MLSPLNLSLGITTNGYLIDRHFEAMLRYGIIQINFSLDALDEYNFERITKRKYFTRVMSNIKKAIDLGFQVKVNAVIIKGLNEDQILPMVGWTLDKKVEFRFIEYMPFQKNQWNKEAIFSYQDMLDLISSKFDLTPIEGHPNQTSKDFKVDGAKGKIGIISSITNPFCEGCNRIRVTADGKLKNCLFSNEEKDLLQAMRNGEQVEELIRESLMEKHFSRGGKDSIRKCKKRIRKEPTNDFYWWLEVELSEVS